MTLKDVVQDLVKLLDRYETCGPSEFEMRDWWAEAREAGLRSQAQAPSKRPSVEWSTNNQGLTPAGRADRLGDHLGMISPVSVLAPPPGLLLAVSRPSCVARVWSGDSSVAGVFGQWSQDGRQLRRCESDRSSETRA